MRVSPVITTLICLLLVISQGACRRNRARAADFDATRPDSAAIADSLASDAIRQANDLTLRAERYADSILSGLPLKRKAAMILMPAAFARTDATSMRRIIWYADSLGVGGIVLLKGSLEAAAEISDTLSSRGIGTKGHIPLFLAVDAENGLRMRFADAPEFPWNRELGKLSDDQLMYEFGREIARECRLVGINMVLGPVMDVVPGSGSGGPMRRRSLGTDPQRVAELAIAYARGVEDGNVVSVAKHFPGHGASSTDTHRGLGEIRSSRSRVDSVDLYPFRRYADEGLSGMMIGHLYVPALDSVRRPAVVSPAIMKSLLRDEIGFTGLVITDALNMEGAAGVAAWQAVAAGADMVIAPADTGRELDGIVAAVRRGDLPESAIDDRCRRILFYKYLLGQGSRESIPGKTLREGVLLRATALRDSLRSHILR